MKIGLSQRFSFAGWDWKKWLKGNKDALKLVVPGIIAYIVTQGIVEAGVAAIVGKAVLDVIDYYASEVAIEK